MTRRRLLLAFVLLLLAGGTLSLPAVHWRLIGWWRGEAFYQGRPTSWWARQLKRDEPQLPPILNYIADGQQGSGPSARPSHTALGTANVLRSGLVVSAASSGCYVGVPGQR